MKIDDFYYRTTASLPTGGVAVINSLDELVPSQSYVVSGTAGQGKSILARRLCLEQAREMADGRIPIFIALGEMDSANQTLSSAISAKFQAFGIAEQPVRVRGYARAKQVVAHIFREGGAVLILDGFDEVNSERQGQLVRQLEDMRRE